MSLIKMNRRAFVATAAWTAASYSRVLWQNNRIRLAVIGPGARGQHVMSLFQKSEQVEIVALADIYDETLDKAKEMAPRAKVFHDYKKLLEENNIDAVLVAVPDHWHTPIALDVLNSGRDIYIEKPLTLAIEQGPQIVKAARINGRIAQVGMQQRSGRHYLRAKRSTSIPRNSARSRWYGPGGTAIPTICGRPRRRSRPSRARSTGRRFSVR